MSQIQYLIIVVCLFTLSCKDSDNTTNTQITTQADILASHMDTTVHPGDDFFTYANGGWLKKKSDTQKRKWLGYIQLSSRRKLSSN